MGAASSTPTSTLATTAGPTPTPIAKFSCPGDDNTVFTSASKQVYRLGCNTDFSGTDLGSHSGSGLFECIQLCEATSGCVATTFASTGMCYFKGGGAKYQRAQNAEGAILNRLTDGKSLSSSASASTSTSTSATRTSASLGRFTTITTTVITSTSVTKTSTTLTHSTVSATVTRPTSTSTLTTLTTSVSSRQNSTTTKTSTSSSIRSSSSTATPSANAKSLTILALGDSITWGYLANESYNSYRLALMNMMYNNNPFWDTDLTPSNDATYQDIRAVGAIHSGNFTQNNCEGYPAMQIDYIRRSWQNNSATYPSSPDVLLLLAGINDIVQNVTNSSTIQAVYRLGSFADDLLTVYPHSTLIVSTLTPVLISNWQPQVALFNKFLPSVMQTRISAGKKIIIVDMNSTVTTDDIADWVHPNAGGYVKMARVFWAGILKARGKGWLP